MHTQPYLGEQIVSAKPAQNVTLKCYSHITGKQQQQAVLKAPEWGTKSSQLLVVPGGTEYRSVIKVCIQGCMLYSQGSARHATLESNYQLRCRVCVTI